MNKILIIVFLGVCCIIAGAAAAVLEPADTDLPAAFIEETASSGWQYTDTCIEEVSVKNILGAEVGRIILSGYFRYNGVDTPVGIITEQYAGVDSLSGVEKTVRVVPYYNTQETRLTLRADAATNMIIPLHRQWYLWISCTKDGEVSSGHEAY